MGTEFIKPEIFGFKVLVRITFFTVLNRRKQRAI